MKHAFAMMATLALLSAGIGQARADVNVGQGPTGGTGGTYSGGADPLFAWTFTETDGNGHLYASGTLSAASNGDVPTTYTALSGTGTVTNGLNSETTLTLSASPNPPGQNTSTGGYFYYDNQLLPGSNPLITNNGLLFTSDVAGQYVNIYSNGPGPNTYEYYTNAGSHVDGQFTLTAVPEPSTMALAGLGALGLIGYGLRRRKALGV